MLSSEVLHLLGVAEGRYIMLELPCPSNSLTSYRITLREADGSEAVTVDRSGKRQKFNLARKELDQLIDRYLVYREGSNSTETLIYRLTPEGSVAVGRVAKH